MIISAILQCVAKRVKNVTCTLSTDVMELKKEMMNAAKDPLFMQDLEESMQDFESSDLETIGKEADSLKIK